VQVGRISRFGLLEMSRQRLRPSLGEATFQPCPRCKGQGTIRGTESLALAVLRIVEEEAMKENTARIVAQLPVDVATFLLNEKRHTILDIETRQEVDVVLVPNPHLERPNYQIDRIRAQDLAKGQEPGASYEIMEKPELEPLQIARSADAARLEEPAVRHISPATPVPRRAEDEEEASPAPRPAGGGRLKRFLHALFPTRGAEPPSSAPTRDRGPDAGTAGEETPAPVRQTEAGPRQAPAPRQPPDTTVRRLEPRPRREEASRPDRRQPSRAPWGDRDGERRGAPRRSGEAGAPAGPEPATDAAAAEGKGQPPRRGGASRRGRRGGARRSGRRPSEETGTEARGSEAAGRTDADRGPEARDPQAEPADEAAKAVEPRASKVGSEAAATGEVAPGPQRRRRPPPAREQQRRRGETEATGAATERPEGGSGEAGGQAPERRPGAGDEGPAAPRAAQPEPDRQEKEPPPPAGTPKGAADLSPPPAPKEAGGAPSPPSGAPAEPGGPGRTPGAGAPAPVPEPVRPAGEPKPPPPGSPGD
jgi:ribonuclease E